MFPLCLALRFAGQQWLPPWMLAHGVLHEGTPFCIDALFLGGAIALTLRGPFAKTLLHLARIILPVCVVAITLAACLTPAGRVFSPSYAYPASLWTWTIATVNLLAALILLCALQPGSFTYRLFRLAPLCWLGRISYGAYVLHDIPHTIYLFIGETLAPHHREFVSILVSFVSTLALAWLSFRYFEAPFLNLKERLTIGSTPTT